MKKYRNKHIIGVLVIVLVTFTLTQMFQHEYILQYLDENKDLQTEVFNSTKEFNKRAEELKADSISYWLN